MTSPAYNLAQHLETKGVGTFGGSSSWAISVSREPVEPDDAVTLYDTGGAAPVLFNEKTRDETIQVRVRSKDYLSAYNKHDEIFGFLNAIINETIGGDDFIGVWLQSDILNVGRDDNDRQILTANYRLERGS